MGIKNVLLLWVLLAIAIIVATSNGFQIMPNAPIVLPDSVMGDALFVCPAAEAGFDTIAAELGKFKGILNMVFMAFLMLSVAIAGWIIYTAMLKDKFEKKSFELPIFLGKSLIFLFVAALMVLRAPNHYKRVNIRGVPGEWILCEVDTPGAKAVRKDALSAGKNPAEK